MADSVLVLVVVDMVLQTGEPLEYRHIAQLTAFIEAVVATGFTGINHDCLLGEQDIHIVIPYHQLVRARGHVGDRKFAVNGTGGIDAFTLSEGAHVQTHPWSGVRERTAVVEGGIRRTRQVQVGYLAADGGATGQYRGVDIRFIGSRRHEADASVRAGGAEFSEKGGFVGLDPCIDEFLTLDGGSLAPIGIGRRYGQNAVFARCQVTNGDGAVRTGYTTTTWQ